MAGSAVGEAAIGIALYKNNKIYDQYYRGLGIRTNAEAEYEAVLHAVVLCYAMDLPDPIIYSDSTLVVNQVNGAWRVNTPGLLPLYLSIIEMRARYRFRLIHQTRKYLWEADALAGMFLDKLAGIRTERGLISPPVLSLPPPPM